MFGFVRPITDNTALYFQGAIRGVIKETEHVALVTLSIGVLVLEMLQRLSAAFRDQMIVPIRSSSDSELDLCVIQERIQVDTVTEEIVHADLLNIVVFFVSYLEALELFGLRLLGFSETRMASRGVGCT